METGGPAAAGGRESVMHGDRLPELTITAGAAQGRESFAVYEQACAPVFDTAIDDFAENDRFSICFSSLLIGGMIFGRADMSNASYRYRRDARKVARSGLDLFLVQLITDGTDTRLVGGREIVSVPGDVFISDLTRTMATRARHCRNFTLALPRALLEGCGVDLDRLHDGFLPARSAPARLLAAHLRMVWSERHRIAPHEAAAVAAGTATLLASLAATGLDPAGRDAGVDASRLTRLRQFIDANLCRPELDADLLCRQFGLSRASLYRLFSPLGGVAAYIRSRRLRQVFRIVAAGKDGRGIAGIAAAHGFYDLSAFNRAFRRQFAMTPSEAREPMDDWPPKAGRTPLPADDGGLLRHWLHSISLR